MDNILVLNMMLYLCAKHGLMKIYLMEIYYTIMLSILYCDVIDPRGEVECVLLLTSSLILYLPQDFTQLEGICVDVIHSRYKHRFIAVYRPPHYDVLCTINMMNCSEAICDVAYGVTIFGDFNMPQVNWANGYDLSYMPALEACLYSVVIDNGLQQLVHDNTRLNNTLDLLLTSARLL